MNRQLDERIMEIKQGMMMNKEEKGNGQLDERIMEIKQGMMMNKEEKGNGH